MWISLGSRLIPPDLRQEWTSDWTRELTKWADAGAPAAELRKRARSSFRDALWRRSRTGYNPVTELLLRPFRAELALVFLVSVAWLLSAWLQRPEPPYPNAERVVILERGISSVGGRRPALSRALAEGAQELDEIDRVALFRLGYRIQGAAFVSEDFFDVLGVTPAMGRFLREGDSPLSAVIADPYWREELGSDPDVVGSTIELAHQEYEVVGVLPASFQFERGNLNYFLPLPDYVETVGGAALLTPGARLDAAETAFRQLASKLEPGWSPKAFGLRGFREPGGREIWLALSLAMAAYLVSAVYLAIQRVRGWKYYLALAARLLLTLGALSALHMVLGRFWLNSRWLPSFLPWWLFLAACTVAAIVVVRDHLGRCPVCLSRLRMPVSLGNWSSVVMDPPGTEYVCPRGHGLLYTPGSGGSDNHWTNLDSSWSELFERDR